MLDTCVGTFILRAMNKLGTKRRVQVVSALVEGNSLRGTARMTGVARMTGEKLLRDLGHVCAMYQDVALRNLPCRRIQVDEIWSFVYAKAKNVTEKIRKEQGPAVGDIWTWTAICAETKLVPSFLVGGRDAGYATEFMQDLAARLTHRVQLTSDDHKVYLQAVEDAFGSEIDYAMLVKHYGNEPEAEKRYSPAVCTGTSKTASTGKPDEKHISTSYAERQNLTMRMNMRRFTRLTNAFSKKIDNHCHAIALHFMYYNFVRIHSSLRTTPAMAAGVTDKLWGIKDMVSLLD
jgi:IS1 family transposase